MQLMRRVMALLIILTLLIAPLAVRAEAIPFGSVEQKATTRRSARGTGRDRLNDITWSTEYLWQAIVNEQFLDVRIYGDGQKLLFKLTFSPVDLGPGYIMTLKADGSYEQVNLAYTLEALDYLESIGVKQVQTVSEGGISVYELGVLKVLLEE